MNETMLNIDIDKQVNLLCRHYNTVDIYNSVHYSAFALNNWLYICTFEASQSSVKTV